MKRLSESFSPHTQPQKPEQGSTNVSLTFGYWSQCSVQSCPRAGTNRYPLSVVQIGMSARPVGVLHKKLEPWPNRMGGSKDVTSTESAMPKTTTLPWA